MLLINANIWTMRGPDIPNGFVRVQGNKIIRVGSMEELPPASVGEAVFDLEGRLLLPGFIDAHSHIGLYSTAQGAEGDDINEDADPCTPHLRALDGIDPFDTALGEAVRKGVTCAVVSPGSANPIAGQVCAIKTKGRWVDRMTVAEPLAIKFALGENPKMTYGIKPQTPVTRMGTAAIIREQLCKAQRYKADLERAAQDDDLDPPEYDARCEALLPLLRGEIAAHFHAHKAYDILTAMRICKEFSLRCVIIHGTEGHLVADILAQEQVNVVCGPLICGRTKPELGGLVAQSCALLSQAGVRLAICTDHPEVPQEYLLMSASVARAGGLSERAAVSAITIAAAEAMELDDRLGSIEPGKDADLLVFSNGLMEVGARPDMVIIDGMLIK